MSKFVITGKNPNLQVGQRYRGFEAGPFFEPRPEQYFLIVARSDAQGWVDSLVAIHGEKERSWLEMLVALNGPWYYYEIQTD